MSRSETLHMGEAFHLTTPVSEIVVRTSLLYLALVALVRIMPTRIARSISPNEMLALVLVGALAADAIQMPS